MTTSNISFLAEPAVTMASIMTSAACRRAPSMLTSCGVCQQQVRFATKKAGGSSNNGRDSAGRRLGVKIFSGFQAKPGCIIVRQRGNKFKAGTNVGVGKDHTLFSKAEGIVKMIKNDRKKNVVHVFPIMESSPTTAASMSAST
jgi:large subunit ribosomal protein L27